MPYTDKVSTCEVFRRACVEKGQMAFLEHEYVRLTGKVVLIGYVEGTRDRGNQRVTLLTYLNKRTCLKPSEIIRQAIDRDMWIQLCTCRAR